MRTLQRQDFMNTPIPDNPQPESTPVPTASETPDWQYDLSLEMLFRNGIAVASVRFEPESISTTADFISLLGLQRELAVEKAELKALREAAQVVCGHFPSDNRCPESIMALRFATAARNPKEKE